MTPRCTEPAIRNTHWSPQCVLDEGHAGDCIATWPNTGRCTYEYQSEGEHRCRLRSGHKRNHSPDR